MAPSTTLAVENFVSNADAALPIPQPPFRRHISKLGKQIDEVATTFPITTPTFPLPDCNKKIYDVSPVAGLDS